MTIRSLAGLTLIVVVGAAGEGRAQDAPLTPLTLAQARVAFADRGQPTALTVRRVYDVDRAARAVTRGIRRAELEERRRKRFEVDLERFRAVGRHRRLQKTNVELRQRHRQLTAELRRLR